MGAASKYRTPPHGRVVVLTLVFMLITWNLSSKVATKSSGYVASYQSEEVSDSAPSCRRQCPSGRKNKIILDHYGAAGLG